jgi:hypothetical protein
VFAHFSLPDLAAVSRRTMLSALVFGVVGFVACLALDALLVGIGLCLGIALGIVNFRMIQSSVVKVGKRQVENARRPLALNTVARLGIITVIALGLLFVSFDLAFGLLAGLAAFQVLLLVQVARSMYKMGAVGGGILTGTFGGFDDDDVIDVEAIDEDAGGPKALDKVEVPDDRHEGS